MMDIPKIVYKNIGLAILICLTTILLISAFVFKMLDQRTASYFFYGAGPLLSGLLGGMQLFSVHTRKDSYTNIFFLSMMIMNLFFIHGTFNGRVWFLCLFPVLMGGVMLVKLLRDVRRLEK